ncbi:MAG: nascent polypeptide-associated complex protein [Thermoplasmatota archaeon]
MMPNVNPKQLQKLMRQMGMSMDQLEGVEEVVIRTADKEYRFADAEVNVMEVKGDKTYQVTGTAEVVDRMSEDDVNLVAEKTGKSRDEARAALKKTDGDIAQAIIDLSG